MSNGADGGDLRTRRKERTRAALIERAQQLTVEHGLTGFTVEELCQQVGVSRRTFFNYFPTKEDAVVGGPAPGLPEEREAAFVAAGGPAHEGLSPTLLTDLARLAIEQLDTNEFTHDADRHRAIVQREPQLVVRILQAGEEHQRRLVDLIVRRERLRPDDPLPRVLVTALSGIVQRTFAEFIDGTNDQPFGDLLIRNLGFAQSLFRQRLDLDDKTLLAQGKS